jgi:hypothetical protein
MDCATLPEIKYFVWALNRSHQMTLSELKRHLELNRSRTILIDCHVIDEVGNVRSMHLSEYRCLPHENPQIHVTSENENPEQLEEEVHAGNFRKYERVYYHFPGWTTIREGKVAYSSTGKKLPPEFFPVFVAREEIFPGSTITRSSHATA